MIEAAAPAGTITQAFSWLPPASEVGAAPRSRRRSTPDTAPGRGDGDRKRSRQVIDRLRLVMHRPGRSHRKAIGLLYAGVQTAANAGVPEDQAGLAAALITASFQLGSALGLAVFSGIATSRTSHLLAARTPPPEALTAGFQRALLVSARCLVAAGAIALRASNTRGESAATPETQQTWNPPTTPHNATQRNPGMAFNAIPGFSLPSGAQLCPSCSRFRAPQSSPLRFLVPGVRTPIRLMNTPG
jgi:hypothetical protein